MYCRLESRSSFESIRYPSFIVFHLTCLRSTWYNHISRSIAGRKGHSASKLHEWVPREFSKYPSFLKNSTCYIRPMRYRRSSVVERVKREINDEARSNTYLQFSREPSARYVFTCNFIFLITCHVCVIKWFERALLEIDFT